MRAHPSVGDVSIMVLLLLVEVAAVVMARGAEHLIGFWSVSAGALLVFPLAFRRKMPVVASCSVLLGLLVQLLGQHPPLVRPASLAALIMLYTLVGYVGRKPAAGYVSVVLLIWLSPVYLQAPSRPLTSLVLLTVQLVLVLGFCWVLGEYFGARRAYQRAVENRLRGLEFERDQQARIAVAEERNRIARELHDVLAHSVNVMVTHADGAAYAVHNAPDTAVRALRTIGDTGREALTELRGLLQVLRNEAEGDENAHRSPQPGVEGVRELVERVRGLGLPVTLRVEGDFDRLPTGQGLGIYRIVQESLTNVLKHAGWNATATVLLRDEDDRVRIEVTDNGAKGVLATDTAPSGNGVIGMRERAAVYGGTLEAGPVAEGGWRVRAELPLLVESATAS
ncbi:Signal transduction histidine kinase [Actinopolyspora lacussalsi subsp. righensis]|uniref:histidine kinase n=2 Tax=Actinopolyspora righensis TaxID=995060 RepID=A0A1I6ZIG6_9ACTN|nr:Signal transduction histidine kinase [Actinopolyspora righensis]